MSNKKSFVCYLVLRLRRTIYWGNGKYLKVHKRHINQPEHCKLKVSEHFALCGKKSFIVFSFYKMYNSNTVERRDKAKHFIRTFNIYLYLIYTYIYTYMHFYKALRLQVGKWSRQRWQRWQWWSRWQQIKYWYWFFWGKKIKV